jgi:hypothetical protein
MKKIILATLLVAFALTTYKAVKQATETKLENKNISFSVYKNSSYTSPVYNSTSAQLHIIVEKVNTKGQHTIIWDKIMNAKELSEYPSIENAVKQNITVHNINQKMEYIVVDYTITYNSEGSELQMHDATVVSDNNSSRVAISI